jgi:aldehyde dehydrogenase (NAD+)
MSIPATAEHWLDGVFTQGHGAAERIEVTNPATEKVIATVPCGGPEDVDVAVDAARRAFPAWSATDVESRAGAVSRISAGLADRRDELAAIISAEMGSPITFAKEIQVGLPVAVSAAVAAAADDVSWSENLGNSLVLREPVGVVGAITPWNYPLHQVVAKLVPALVAGCTVVLKPSEIAPLTARILAEIVAGAGVPAGVFNVVHGFGESVGEAIAAHPGIDMVSFTGSTRAGRRVSALASDTVKRVALELGGKSANVILDDADLTKAVKLGIANCFINGGQTCTAWTRMLVPASRLDEALQLVIDNTARYTVGDPSNPKTRIGPMSSANQRDRVLDHLRTGVAEGAEVVAGGPDADPGMGHGAYVAPTVFVGVQPEMAIAQQEIFGPALAILAYGDEDEAAEIANGTMYGLAGAVFSSDHDRAVAFARRMRTGRVDVNGGSFNFSAPFGGYKQSGNGRELGRHGIEEFCELKSIQL